MYTHESISTIKIHIISTTSKRFLRPLCNPSLMYYHPGNCISWYSLHWILFLNFCYSQEMTCFFLTHVLWLRGSVSRSVIWVPEKVLRWQILTKVKKTMYIKWQNGTPEEWQTLVNLKMHVQMQITGAGFQQMVAIYQYTSSVTRSNHFQETPEI